MEIYRIAKRVGAVAVARTKIVVPDYVLLVSIAAAFLGLGIVIGRYYL